MLIKHTCGHEAEHDFSQLSEGRAALAARLEATMACPDCRRHQRTVAPNTQRTATPNTAPSMRPKKTS